MNATKPKLSVKQILAILILINMLFVLQSIPVTANPVSPTIYLDDLPSQASFTIKKLGSTYYALRDDGYLAYEGSTFSTVFNNARAALGDLSVGAPGLIFIHTGTYTVTSDLTIGKKTQVVGESGTIFDVTAALSNGAIVIDSTNIGGGWRIENLEIDMNSNNGNGIYSGNGDPTNTPNVEAAIRNVYIHAVKAGYSGIYITNIMNTELSNIRITTYGTGIKLDTVNTWGTLYYGNSWLNHIRIGLSGASAIGLDVSHGTTLGNGLIFLTVNSFQTTGSDQVGTIGIRMRGGSESTFTKVYIEDVATGIDIDDQATSGEDAYDINFFGLTIHSIESGNTAMKIGVGGGSASYNIRTYAGTFRVKDGGIFLNYGNDGGTGVGALFDSVVFLEPWGGTGTFTIAGDLDVGFRNCTGYP